MSKGGMRNPMTGRFPFIIIKQDSYYKALLDFFIIIILCSKQWEFSTDIPDVTPQDSIAQLYFEMLNIQPITFDLSFMRTDKYDDQTR